MRGRQAWIPAGRANGPASGVPTSPSRFTVRRARLRLQYSRQRGAEAAHFAQTDAADRCPAVLSLFDIPSRLMTAKWEGLTAT